MRTATSDHRKVARLHRRLSADDGSARLIATTRAATVKRSSSLYAGGEPQDRRVASTNGLAGPDQPYRPALPTSGAAVKSP